MPFAPAKQTKDPIARDKSWDPETGYPKRETLKHMGFGYVAYALEADGRSGR